MCESIGLNISHLILQTPTPKANMIQFDGLSDSQSKITECVSRQICFHFDNEWVFFFVILNKFDLVEFKMTCRIKKIKNKNTLKPCVSHFVPVLFV